MIHEFNRRGADDADRLGADAGMVWSPPSSNHESTRERKLEKDSQEQIENCKMKNFNSEFSIVLSSRGVRCQFFPTFLMPLSSGFAFSFFRTVVILF
jgi:hypothetical protein